VVVKVWGGFWLEFFEAWAIFPPDGEGQCGEQSVGRVFDLGVPGDHGGVDGIGFFQRTHALGELADGAGVEDGHAKALPGEQGEGLLFVASGGFHGHQMGLVGAAKGRQSVDSGGVIGKGAAAPRWPMRASRDFEATSTPQIMRVTVTFLVGAIEFMRLFGRARLGQRSRS
jgi:hypothetical protein